MAITPRDIESKQFPVVVRGFDQQAVTAFLQSVAADYTALQAALQDYGSAGGPTPKTAPPPDLDALVGDEVTKILRTARHVSEELQKRANKEAETLRSNAREEATATAAQSKREAEDILSDARSRLAQLTRDEQELANWLQSMRSDIELLLHRRPPNHQATDSDAQHHSSLERQPSRPLAINGPAENLQSLAADQQTS